MRNSFFKYFLSICIAFAACPAFAADVSVKANLDSVSLLMGKIGSINLKVSQPVNVKGHFPIFSKLQESGVIPVCNDSVEFRMPVNVDTVVNDNFMEISMSVPVQAFDSGLYQLPQFVYVVGHDSVKSNALALKVVPVLAKKDTPIDDYASVSDPENKSLFDNIPDWLYDFWWIFLIFILALAAGLFAYFKYRKNGYIIPKKPEPTPYEKAISGLKSLKEQKLWEQGMEKEYFTVLTDILREYLYGRFGINAIEMTSREILNSLSNNPELRDKRKYMRQILNMADFVKFAKVRPLPDDNVAAFDNALKFVEETKPVPPTPRDEKGGEK